MKLIFLHGPPASGKYTIAKELEKLVGSGIFHNHLTIDTAKPFFDFGTDNFWKLVHQLRLTCLSLGAENNSRIVTYTSCYDHPNDLPQFEEIEKIIHDNGGDLLPVYLKCDQATLEKRVTSEPRVSMGKIRTVDGLRDTMKRWNCIEVPRPDCLILSTGSKNALQCAEEIVRHFKLS